MQIAELHFYTAGTLARPGALSEAEDDFHRRSALIFAPEIRAARGLAMLYQPRSRTRRPF